MKKTIATVGILSASLVAYFSMNTKEFVPAPLDFNGTVIEMTHTDDNEGEDLIIYTDKATYSSWDTAEVIFSVTNLSSKGQNVTKRFLFGKTEQTESVEEYIADVPYIVTVDDYAEKETCEMVKDSFSKKDNKFCSKKKVGSHEETHYKDMWVNTSTIKGQRPKDTANQQRIGKVLDSKYKTDSESTTFIESGETKYYRAIVKFAPKSEQTEFYIEASGDLGAFGNLDPWYSSSWLYRIPITIDDAKVASTQTGFPVQVDITNASLAAGAQADGDDILFTSSDGTTKLDHEIEIYTTATGRLTAWVEIPSLTGTGGGDTVIYLYYGNSGASNQQNPTGVWDSNYKGVWHFKDGSTLSMADSTSNGYTGTNNNSAQATAGKIDGALNENNSGEYITTSLTSNNTNITVSGWMYTVAQNAAWMATKVWDGSTDGYELGVAGASGGNVTLRFAGYSGGFLGIQTSTATVSLNAWHYIVGTYDGTQWHLYINGALSQSVTASGPPLASTGGTNIGSTPWNGKIDEVRVSFTNRSTDWISTEYNNQSATSTFYTIGSQETDTPAATTPSQNIIFFE